MNVYPASLKSDFLLFSPDIIGLSLVFIIGLALGSFATALSYRIPRGIAWGGVQGGSGSGSADKAVHSQCPSCGTRLQLRDLVPFFSWLFLKGRCRHCGHKISFRYPLIELFCAILCVFPVMYGGWSPGALFLIMAAPFLVALLVIDLEYKRLPDQLILILLVLGVFFAISQKLLLLASDRNFADYFFPIITDLGAAMLSGGIYAFFAYLLGRMTSLMVGRSSLGMGDVKFFAISGVWLSISLLPVYLILAGALGLVFGVLWRFFKKEQAFPFGPAIIMSMYFCVIFGDYFKSLFML